MIHQLLILHRESKHILYSEKLHSQAEYVGCLFDLAMAVKDFPEVEIAYLAPFPIVGKPKSKVFHREDILELVKLVKGERNEITSIHN